MTAAIVNTPYTLSFCILTTATPSSATGRRALSNASGSVYAATVMPCPLPTYFDPPTSEAFLGNNGFYTGVPGDPALYPNAEGSNRLDHDHEHRAPGLERQPSHRTGSSSPATPSPPTPGESMTWTSDQL